MECVIHDSEKASLMNLSASTIHAIGLGLQREGQKARVEQYRAEAALAEFRAGYYDSWGFLPAPEQRTHAELLGRVAEYRKMADEWESNAHRLVGLHRDMERGSSMRPSGVERIDDEALAGLGALFG